MFAPASEKSQMVDNYCTDVDQLELPPQEHIEAATRIFKALSDPTRLQIITQLMEHELCVHDITSLLGLTQPAISHHLRILRDLHLVKFRKEGRHVIYTLDDDHVHDVVQHVLDHVAHS